MKTTTALFAFVFTACVNHSNSQMTQIQASPVRHTRDTSIHLEKLNIDFMNRGYFYAYSTLQKPGEDNSGGWAVSDNFPHIITNEKGFAQNSLSVVIDTNLIDTFANRFYGVKLYVCNTTKDTVQFNAQDSRLYMQLQALNHNGEWADIGYLPGSTCGNSYHTIALEPNAYWSFTIPEYHGKMRTKIRAALKYITAKDPEQEQVIYSNVVEASINKGQFFNKNEYHPNGIMDPYEN